MKSMFDMDDSHRVLGMDLESAKRYLTEKVNNSSANRKNTALTLRNIQVAKSTRALSGLVANYVLAHPENGRMKVL